MFKDTWSTKDDMEVPLCMYIIMLLKCQEYYITVLCYDLRIHWFYLGKGIQQCKELMIVHTYNKGDENRLVIVEMCQFWQLYTNHHPTSAS
jgi:hypothetical protein